MNDPRRSTRLALLAIAAVLARPGCPAGADDAPPPRPTVVVRAVHPDREVEAVLGLFRGSRAADPAAALAAWKRATVEPRRLGKPVEAVLAAFNPLMIPEYRLLDDAEVAITLDPTSGRGWQWRARVPHDDGTLANAGPTLALSGGAIEPPAGGVEVDRLAGAGSTLLAKGRSGLVLASTRAELDLAMAAPATSTTSPIESGWLFQVDPRAGDTWTTPAGRRWAEAARVARCDSIAGRVRLAGTTGLVEVVGRFSNDTPVIRSIDPGWLDPVPVIGPLAVVAFRVDPRAESWTALFDGVDRVERTDPARAMVAPTRARLALAARAAGVRVEADLWPHLEGVAGWVGAEGSAVDRAFLALYLDDEAAAARLVGGLRGPRTRDGLDEVIAVGSVGGRPLRVVRRRSAVFLAWGDRTWAEARAALDAPNPSARLDLARGRNGDLPARVGALWPARLPDIAPGTPLAGALAEAPPIRWSGHNEASRTVDEFWAAGLDGTVRRFLDRIPQAPATAP